jgi:hypothetical protein
VTNGELVTVKAVQPDGGIKLTDGRVLDKSFREFLPGYAVTSYGSQGKTVDCPKMHFSSIQDLGYSGFITISPEQLRLLPAVG